MNTPVGLHSLHARRAELVEELATQRVALFDAARSLRGPLAAARGLRDRIVRVAGFWPIVAFAIGAIVLIRRRRAPVATAIARQRRPERMKGVLELVGLVRMALTAWRSMRTAPHSDSTHTRLH